MKDFAVLRQRQVRRLKHANLGHRVHADLRRLILGQAFPPGSRLNVERLCRHLGVSRTPVWDAMKRLETEGLVETVPRQGVFVLNFSLKRVREVYSLREVLEGLSASLAAEHMGPAELASLASDIRRQEVAVTALDYEAFSRADLDFHNRILAGSKNQLLRRVLESIYGQILVLRLRATLNSKARIESSFAEHRQVFDAVTAKDPERAGTAARMHVRMVTRDVLEGLRGRGHWGFAERGELVGSSGS